MTVDPAKPRQTLADLIEVMAALRTPVTGCPWDIEQDFKSIAPYTIEEAYEVADAIQRGDLADLEEELGDLLLQVVYHAQMAREQRAFNFEDVVHGITTKMIRRHPHVFGDAAARSAGAAKGFWERIKAEEKSQKTGQRAARGLPPHEAASLLDDVPVAMPALTRATKLQAKAAKVGFDWSSFAPVLAKVKEELAELELELHRRPDAEGGRTAEEFGDLLFAMTNVARHLGINAEDALHGANAKFARRFRSIEARLAAAGRTLEQSDLEEMDRLWDAAKSEEKR